MRKVFSALSLASLFLLGIAPAIAQQAAGRGFSGRVGLSGRPAVHPGSGQAFSHVPAPRGFSGMAGPRGHFGVRSAPARPPAGGSPGSFPMHNRQVPPFSPQQVPGFSGSTTFVPPGLGFDSVHSALVHRGFPFPFPHHPSFGFGFDGFFSPCHRCIFGGPFVSHRFFLPRRHHLFFPFVPFFPTCTVFFTPGFLNGSTFFSDSNFVADDPPASSASGLEAMTSTYVPGPQAEDVSSPQPPRPHFVLVFKDHSIYGITGYSIHDGRIYYATSYGAVNSVPLELVDLDSTVQMNREQGLDFSMDLQPVRDP